LHVLHLHSHMFLEVCEPYYLVHTIPSYIPCVFLKVNEPCCLVHIIPLDIPCVLLKVTITLLSGPYNSIKHHDIPYYVLLKVITTLLYGPYNSIVWTSHVCS
jgi:hypothetical protein